MTPLKLPTSAFAMIVAACGGNVALENSTTGQPGSPSTGGTANGGTAVTAAGGNSSLQGGLVVLPPELWAQIADPACAGSSADINPRQGIPDDASIPIQGRYCVYPLPSASGHGPDPNMVNIVYAHGDPPSIRYIIGPSDSNCANRDGWYVSTDGFQFVLCAKTCSTVQQDPSSMIDVRVGCSGPIILN